MRKGSRAPLKDDAPLWLEDTPKEEGGSMQGLLVLGSCLCAPCKDPDAAAREGRGELWGRNASWRPSESCFFHPKHNGAVSGSRRATRTIVEGECEAPVLWASDMGQVPPLFPRDGSGGALCRFR